MKKGLLILASLSLLTACATGPPYRTGLGYGTPPSQTIELYDASGKHLGYGHVQGGMIDVYRPDGSRAGYGKTGR